MAGSSPSPSIEHASPASFTGLLPNYRVILHNDDVNSMDHVVLSLMKVFGFDRAECIRIMLEAHKNGSAQCIIEPHEPAEFHRDKLVSCSLVATIEPV